MQLPKKFLEYIFYKRIEVLKKMSKGEPLGPSMMIEFTRTTPAVITDGPAGLSGSIKMVGFVPKQEYIDNLAKKAEHYAYEEDIRDMKDIARVLLEEFYREEVIDFTKLGGLEMGFKHSWINIRATGKATLLFYTPPIESYEVRCDVKIHEDPDDPYTRYLNALHDIFHRSTKRSTYPAYLFTIKEIYDNSVKKNGFGTKIY
ncbi:hypothetical protein J4526_05775 [Desulfurococcaceae archaeon MEX13E-LK6-19]|nr:hypothetical protein J4526_05775 [Desulfurococcaceae archaeon MEX13E-LK6-19]